MQMLLRQAALVVLLSSGFGAAHAQVSLTTPGTPVTQDFNSLPTSGTSTWANNTTIPGWYHARTGTGTTIVANNGAGNGGSLYSYGTGTDAERALGSLGSSNATAGHMFWGLRLQNNTGATLTSLTVSYTGEQWRNGAGTAQTATFSYIVGSPTVNGTLAEFQSAGTAVPALDFTSPVTGGTAGALDGNSAANRVALSTTITGLNIPAGSEILLRWSDPDQTGSDHGLSIDDVAVTVPGTPSTNADLSITISDSPDPVAQGGTLTYSIVASNAGPDAAENASVKIPVPAGTSWISQSSTGAWDCASAGQPPANGPGTFTCTLASFASGTSDTFSLSVQVLGTTTGPLGATPTITSNSGDPTPGNNSATAITTVDVPVTAIHTLQGPGASSPIVGQTIRTRGIVTGRKGNGFFLQAADAEADADPLTSEGVFVFTSSAPPAAAAVGSLVTVDGRVLEYVPTADPQQLPLTEIGFVTSVVSLSVGNALPQPIALTATFPDPTGPLDQLERLEGMRVTATSFTVAAPTQGNTSETNATGTSNGILHAVVTGVARPFREAGIQIPDTPPGGGTTPPIPRWDFNPELLTVDSDSLGAPALDVAAGSVITGLVGPLDYGFRRYTVMREPATAIDVSAGASAQAARVPGADEFTVASFNLERFFDTVKVGSEPALTPLAYANRLNKASLGIRNYLNAPDILGVVEIENLSTLQDLAAKINADAVAAGQPDPQYVAYLQEGNDVGGIDVGFLVKTAAVGSGIARVQVLAVSQHGKATTWVEPDGSSSLLNDRPPLALDALVRYADGRTFPITAIVVHQRSLNGAETNDAGGDRVRQKRQTQAEFLANLIQGMQVADPARNIIAVGDYNAFEFNDGYVDAMNVVIGTPTADAETAVPGDGADLVDPDLVNLAAFEDAGERYSFVFGGNAQSLDHVVANEMLLASTASFALDHARINADFPEVARSDANSPLRLSDHDPAIAYFAVNHYADLGVSVSASSANVYPGGQLGFTARLDNLGPDAAQRPGIGFAIDAELPTMAVVPSDAGWSCDAPEIQAGVTSVACSTSTLAIGTVSFAVSATVTAELGGRTLTLVVAADAKSVDAVPGNDHDSASVVVGPGQHDLGVEVSGPANYVRSGARAVFPVVVRNLGPALAAQPRIIVRGNVPVASVTAPTAAGWTCDVGPHAIGFEATCTTASVAVDAPQTLDFALIAPRYVKGSLRVEAVVTSKNANPRNDAHFYVVPLRGMQ